MVDVENIDENDKILELLKSAFPLKEIKNDIHLAKLIKAIDMLKSYLNASDEISGEVRSQIETYINKLEELESDYLEKKNIDL